MLSLEEEVEGVQEDLEEPAPEDRGCGGWGGAGSASPDPRAQLCLPGDPQGTVAPRRDLIPQNQTTQSCPC